MPSLGQVSSKICVSPGGQKIVQNVIFVIDQSGSNGPHTNSLGSHPGNDPAKTFRHGSMEPFYNYHKSNPNFRWGFIYFSGQVVDAYIKEGGEPALTPEGDSLKMAEALSNFMANPDVSGSMGTNYTDALAKTERLLLNDLAAREAMNNKGEVHDIYDIFFVSDGLPINSLGETPISGPGDSRIRLIADLIGKKSGDIRLHTAFYQTPRFKIQPPQKKG